MKKVQELFNTVRRGLFGGASNALGLAKRAGGTGGEVAGAGGDGASMLEQLEKREYLFVLTVDQNNDTFEADPNRPHYGTVTADFAYFLPFLLSNLPAIGVTGFTASGIGNPASAGPGIVLGPTAGAQPGSLDVDGLNRNRMAAWLEDRMAGVTITLYGRFEDDPNTPQVELPTSIQVFDLYGRDMQQRLDIGRPSPFDARNDGLLPGTVNLGNDTGRPAGPGNNPPAIPVTAHNQVPVDSLEATGDRGNLTGTRTDFNRNGIAANIGDGVPDMNDGFGGVVIIQSDALTRINMTGGQVVRVTGQADFDRIDGAFDDESFYGIDIPDNEGDQEWWDDQGFGFGIIPNTNPPDVSGLPEIGGSIVFGAPWIRDNTDSNTYFGVDTNAEFEGGLSILPEDPLTPNFTAEPLRTGGPVTVDGVVINTLIMGIRTLRADQAVGEINVPGLMMGTVNITGSLGLFNTQHMLGSLVATGDVGEIYIGGTSGYWVREDQRGDGDNLDNLRGTGSSISVGGRLGTMFVAGRNRANIFVTGDTTNPRQRVEGSTFAERETVFGVNPNLEEDVLSGALNGGTIRMGNGTYRNDSFATAEFIYSGLNGTTISGSLGLIDPLNEEDLADFYAFAADAGRTVQMNVIFPNPQAAQNAGQAYVRVYDQNGELVATHGGAGSVPADTTNPTNPRTGFNFQFVAPGTGVYFLVVGVPGDGNFQSSLQYQVTMAGQAATTLGQLVVGGGLSGFTVSVSSGVTGRISGGRGVLGGNGAFLQADSDASGIPTADYLDSAGFNFSVSSLYNLAFGADVGGGFLTASNFVGGVQIAGGVLNFTANLSRQLGSLDVGGQTGVQENTILARNAGATGAVVIRTGSTGVPGHIGRLQFGDLVRGDQFTLQTAQGSFVDVLEVLEGGFTVQQPTFNLGQGSDIRFASFPSVRLANPGQQDIDFFLPITANTPVTLTDDSGVTFTITATGIGSAGTIRVSPAGQLGGLIVGRIDVNLGATGQLNIATTSQGSLALGEINVSGGGFNSNVNFSGPAEIDVRILRVNGQIRAINNTTPDGDIVSADVLTVQTVSVNGSIGATRTYVLSANDIAARIGIAQGLQGAVGGPVGIPANLINAWNAGVFVPFVYANAPADDRTLEDSGSPIDSILNGIVVRTGNVTSITARGSIGDVILQGGTGTNAGGRVGSITANSDRANTTGRFEGITGSVFVGELTSLDVGDGILAAGPTPFARAGVFALDDIVSINAGTRVLNPQMTGVVIIASNVNAALNDNAQGIGTIRIVGASLDRSYIHSANLDSWWRSARYGTDRVEPSGSIQSVTVSNGNVVRTDFHALNVGTIAVTGGRWDATSVQATLSINTISADRFTSSLSTRDPLQYYFNQIRAGLDVQNVRVNNQATGDIEDLFISAGRNNTSISARNLLRSNVDIRGNAGTMTFRGDVRASSIGSGRLQSMAVTGDIRSSTVRISGAIVSLTAGGDITDTEIVSSGPDGRINNLTATGTITGSVTSSGPIGTIRTTRGDINITLTTTDGSDGSVGTIQAGRDLVLSLDMVDGTTVNTLRANRHIGRRLVDGTTPDLLDIPGNVTTINAGGVLYSDVLVGGTIGTITSGRATAYLPTADFATDAVITASGRINTVNINGDFNGSIISYSGGIGSVTITNGSFRAGNAQRDNRIEALDGDITSVRIVRGHLLGDVLAPQGSIGTISVTGDTIFGNIGVSPALVASATSQAGVPIAERRTHLPVGFADPTASAARTGPTIAAGVNIGTITTTGGVFEATITAGRQITGLTIGRGIDNAGAAPTNAEATIIAAGDRVNNLTVTGQARNTFVSAGLTSLGDDGLRGGTGADADTVKSGTIGTLNFRGGTDGVFVAAGLQAGADGIYNNADDRSAPGISTVQSVQVTGTAANTVVRTESGTVSVSANLNAGSNSVGGQTTLVADNFAIDGAIPGATQSVTSAGRVFTIGGQLRRVVFTGAGTATYTNANIAGFGTGVLVLTGTTTSSTLRIEAAPAGSVSSGVLAVIAGRDDASLGTLSSTVDVSNLTTVLDGVVNTATFRGMTNAPVRTGQRLGSFTAGSTGVNTQVQVESRGEIGTFRTLSGIVSGVTQSFVQGLTIGSTNVGGQLQGRISSDRDITGVTVSGLLTTGSGVRAGYNMGAVNVGSMNTATIGAGGNIASVRVNGDVLDSAILSGVDLGRNADFGGNGANADTVSNGNMGAVNVTGAFRRSDIGAGVYQGTDGFLGTQDDLLGDGRSTLGAVTITGQASGSLLNTESYRIISNGTMGTVRAQGLPLTSVQNLLVVSNKAAPDPLRVVNVDVQFIGGVYFATIFFNQPVNPGTLSGALSISEIRGFEPTLTEILLVENADYTVTYSAGATSAIVQFSQDVTRRDLDLTGDAPNNGNADDVAARPVLAGPGVFRFTLDSALVSGQSDSILLDGDGDGVAESSDNWTDDFIIGDAGDRILESIGRTPDLSVINFYGPADLDLVMGNVGLANTPQTNRTFSVQGYLGDHPDHIGTFFEPGSDVDIYGITLQAGQILSANIGTSLGVLTFLRPDGPQLVGLVDDVFAQGLADGSILALQDVTVFMVITSDVIDPFLEAGNVSPQIIIGPDAGQDPNNPDSVAGAVVNLPANAAVGNYTLSVRISDDGDNGFNGATDASNGTTIENAPLPGQFSGVDGLLGTSDDLASITVGQYVYRLEPGANNVLNGNGTATLRSDDVVIGVNAYNTEQVRTAGADGRFGTTDDVTQVNSAIGQRNAVGGGLVITNDLDVIHLNGGNALVAGQRYRFTLRVSEFGGDIGGIASPRPVGSTGAVGVPAGAVRGQAQFALFEVTGNGINAGNLVAQSPNPEAYRATPNTVIADDGITSYGYDASGDFYMEVTVPPSQADDSVNARFALYVQGAHQSNYTVEVVRALDGAVPTEQSQNFLLETNGGVIEWLEAFGASVLESYTGSVNANVPGLDGQSTRAYILSNLIANLNEFFDDAGIDVNISLSSADFVGQAFSTVFITDSLEPADQINQNFFGVVERRDLLNANRSDQAVVFAPAVTALGNTVDQPGLDAYIRSMTAAVAQRMGELLGITFADGGSMTSGIPAGAGGLTLDDLGYNDNDTGLSQTLRSSFILGNQNDSDLLRRIFQVAD